MLRNYTERLASQLPHPSQRRKFIEDVVRGVVPERTARQIQGKRNDDILKFLDTHDPITRSDSRNIDSLMDVYIDRTFNRFIDIANPTPEAAREQISGLVEGLAGATEAVVRLGSEFQWSDDKSFARDLLTGAAIQPLTEGLTPQEAEDTGAAALAQSTDPSGGAMRRFLAESGSGRGLSRISDKSAIRLAKKTWPLWEKIGSLSRSELRISTPDFSTNEGKFTPSKMIPVSTSDPLVSTESITELAGRLVRKGAQLAYKARAKQGKMVRKMILLSDALGIFGGGLINDPRVIDRDDNLAKAISGARGGGRSQFPEGEPVRGQPGRD